METNKTFKYIKICLCCKKEYGSDARGQRFCTPFCQKKYAKRLDDGRKFYSENKSLNRIKARAHSLAVEIKTYELHSKGLPYICERCGDAPIDEVHHKNLNFLDNTPENLKGYCKKCHALEHSELSEKLKEEGKTVEEFYNQSFFEFIKPIMKGKK